MLVLLISAVFLSGLFLTLFWFRRLRTFQSLNRFPGPKLWPLLGNALEFGTNLTDVLNNMMRLSKEYGSTYKIYMGPYSVNLIVAEPIHVEHFLSSANHINRSGLHDNFKPFLGNSLACSKDDTWRRHRKLLLPAFHNDVLEKCMPIFNAATTDLIETLHELTDRDFNCAPVISEHALSIICGSVMGESSKHEFVVSNHAYMDSLNALMAIAMARVFSVFERNDLIFRISNNYRQQSKHIKIVHEFADGIIANMRKKRRQGAKNGVHKERENFLGFMLDLEEKGAFTEQDVRDEMNVLLFAGHDTVATSIAFGLYELAKHPDVQDKIYEEAFGILGPNFNSHLATIKDIESLKYLSRCMKETLRLYTIAPFFDRELAHRDILDGTWIPKETIITFFPYAMHRNPRFYPEPERFDPERWREEVEMRRPKYAFIPFSGGPRNCIGFKFGILEWKLTIARIILSFRIEPVEGFEVELAMHGVLKSKNGMQIRLRKRV